MPWADDMSWIEGILEYEPLEGGMWFLRFGPSSAPLGGVAQLLGRAVPGDATAGQQVRATGSPSEAVASIFMSGQPMYDVAQLSVV